MNIFVVEDSAAIRRLLVRRLDDMSGMRVVGEAAGQSQALTLIHWSKPDMVLVDLTLASGTGLGLVADLRREGFSGRIAVLTAQDLDALRRACLDAGADAFYDKGTGLETLFDDLAGLVATEHGALDAPAARLRGALGGPPDLARDRPAPAPAATTRPRTAAGVPCTTEPC